MSKEEKLKNIKDMCKGIANCETEADYKTRCQVTWGWLAIRSIANGYRSSFDDAIALLLEEIESCFDWGISTMAEIEAELEALPKEDESTRTIKE